MKLCLLVAFFFTQIAFCQLSPEPWEKLIGSSETTTLTKSTSRESYILNFKCQFAHNVYNHLFIGQKENFYKFLNEVWKERNSDYCATQHVYRYEGQKVLAWYIDTAENEESIYLAVMLQNNFLGTLILKVSEIDKLFGIG